MSIWFLLNGLLLIWAIWNVASGVAVHTSYIHILLGFTGFLFFIFNWTRNAVFSTIRNIENRQTKIRLATMSKRIRAVPPMGWGRGVADHTAARLGGGRSIRIQSWQHEDTDRFPRVHQPVCSRPLGLVPPAGRSEDQNQETPYPPRRFDVHPDRCAFHLLNK